MLRHGSSFSHELKHVAIIMDGNGRWANERARPRMWGHVRGSAIVSEIVEKADSLGIKALTLYAFSTENWSRPATEVRVLFKLLYKFLLKERDRILKNRIRFRVMGDITHLPIETKNLIFSLENETKDFHGLKLTFAFGYGGRMEIVSAVNSFMLKNPGKAISEDDLAKELFVPDLGDVDLLIRTGGDQRVSNFLLWQIAYAEFFFTETKWPDFTASEFQDIIEFCASRERRFGAISKLSHLAVSKEMASINKGLLRN